MFLGYNFSTMLKRIPVAAKIILGTVLCIGVIVAMTYEEHRAAAKYQGTCEKLVANVTASASEENASSPKKCDDPKDYMPWWYVLISWPEGIGGWALLATGFFIACQSLEMRKGGDIAERTLILQYRPRVIVRSAAASNFNLADLGKTSTAKVKLTVVNIGGSTARITGGVVALWWAHASHSEYSNKVVLRTAPDKSIGGDVNLEPGERAVWEETVDMDATIDLQWANYHAGLETKDHRTVILVGTVYYRDELGISRQTGIHRKYDPKTSEFVANKESEQEYTD